MQFFLDARSGFFDRNLDSLAARLPLEMLDDVRHVGERAVDTGLLHRLDEELARGASAFAEPSPKTVWVPVFHSG